MVVIGTTINYFSIKHRQQVREQSTSHQVRSLGFGRGCWGIRAGPLRLLLQ